MSEAVWSGSTMLVLVAIGTLISGVALGVTIWILDLAGYVLSRVRFKRWLRRIKQFREQNPTGPYRSVR